MHFWSLKKEILMDNQAHTSNTTRLAAQSNCDLIQDLLPLYLEHEVSENSHQLITEHIANCEHCRSYLAGARSMKAQLRREGVQRQNRAAHDDVTAQAVALGRKRLAQLLIGGVGAAIGIVVIAIFTMSIWNSRSRYETFTFTVPTMVPPENGRLLVPNAGPGQVVIGLEAAESVPTAVITEAIISPPQVIISLEGADATPTPVPFQVEVFPDPQSLEATATPFQ
jgi:predicted anti-sigma-YlaC factor YlaD